MSELFSQKMIGKLKLNNRIIRTASHEGLADRRGAPTEEQFNFYRAFVEGGIGMIITGYAGIMQNGKSSLYHMTMIDDDELIPAHQKMVEKLHNLGGKIVCQIAHCGRQTLSEATGECALLAPSSIPNTFFKEVPRELSQKEIIEIISRFASAAKRVQKAGYDGVQIHGAHGYLLSTFLTRRSNKRKDKWGGSKENRFRIVAKTLKAVREEVGKDYPVLIKLNSFERWHDGIKPAECVEYARMVEKTGCCDAIEISAGSDEDSFYMARGYFPTEGILKYLRPYCKLGKIAKGFIRYVIAPFNKLIQPPFKEGYNLETAARVKQAVSLPVITVGGMRSKAFMESAIREGKTDFVSLARPLLLEPDLANKFMKNESESAKCDNCNICFVATDTAPIQCHKDEFVC
ncbi:MAG: NADH:flavin oxidoreductase [Proteobacteria bacterium]|nr:NADH:flavin oxidoreductase [Pseudomonadota bacterium]